MSEAFACATVAVLLITVRSTMAFPSNIHEEMTSAEKLAVFGSASSVPEYQVFSLSVPGARRRRETDEALKLNIELEDKQVNLTLKPTEGHLTTKYTPVWLASSDEHAYQKIRYDPYARGISAVGKFKMYHDVENGAAVTAFTDPSEVIIIEGIVTPYYAIRSLPKRLMGENLTVGRHIIVHDYAKKRSVTSDHEEDTGHFAVFKIPAASNHVKRSALVDRQRKKRADQNLKHSQENWGRAVYPEILVVLDHNAIRDRTIVQALRFILAFWNGADLIYRPLDKPKVHLNIAGIIIAAVPLLLILLVPSQQDEWATPYIASNASVNDYKNENHVVSKIGKYFYKEMDRFPMTGYDMIIAMSTIHLCAETRSMKCFPVFDDSNRNTACLSTHKVSRMKNVMSTGLIGYNWLFTGIIAAARATAHIFGDEFEKNIIDTDCTMTDGHIMSEWFFGPPRTFEWSSKSKCLHNDPQSRYSVGPMLPGRWMSMNGQCRNDGFAKACTQKKKSMCTTKYCKAEDSVKCVRTTVAPLPGSKCKDDKHCSTKKKCVPN